MKSTYQIILLFLLSFFTFSCVDNLTDFGAGIQPASDQITVGTDTFHLNTENIFVESMFLKPDSFLLGRFYNGKFGTTKADILAQVNCPVDFKFPPLSVPDSAFVYISYSSWFGDKLSSLDVNVYEMTKKTFTYTTPYATNIDPTEYYDPISPSLLGKKIFTAQDASNLSSKKTALVIPLDTGFVKRRFFNPTNTHYNSTSDFLNFFKGIYITTNFGSSTILNIGDIDIVFFYHYTYKEVGTNIVKTVKNILTFPANKEVRQVNRIVHDDRIGIVKQRDSVNYVASPVNLNTRVNLPLVRIKQKIDFKIAGKKQILNKALLKVEVTEIEDTTLAMPLPNYMLLIKESDVDNYFKDKKIPTSNDTCAVLAQISASQIGTTGKYEYYYSFNLASVISNQLRKATITDVTMVLMPVNVTSTNSSNGSSTITGIKPQYRMSAATIRSGKNPNHPMKLSLIYSGF